MTALAPYATRHARHGVVCAVDHLAAEAGVSVMRSGGSAADAAVAASAVLAVTTQHMCGMGGDLFALVHDGTAVHCLNASGRAGSGADADRLRAEGHTVMPFRKDIRSVPVPGCVDGWVALHGRFGRLPLADVLEPARASADGGFPASPLLAAAVPQLAGLAEAGDYLDGGPLREGDLVRRPAVARALAGIGADGRAAFYEGEFGEGLVRLGAGEYTAFDLARPLADWVTPLRLDAWDRSLWTVPPNSQGYLTLAGAWIVAGLDLPDDPDDPAWAHLTIEAARQAAYDRPDVLHEAADGIALLAPDRLGPRRADIDPDKAAVLGDTYVGGGTIYLCAVDDQRMGVSLIQSNAAGFGSLLAEPGTRIFLQNRGVGFSLEPGHPAEYGPGRRPPHTLSPALVTTTGAGPSLDMVIGTMGGDSQPQVLLQLLARLLHGGGTPPPVGDAVAAPRWRLASPGGSSGFDTWRDRGRVVVQVEGNAAAGWAEGLAARGHAVDVVAPFEHGFGHAHVIRVTDGALAGASDPRALVGAAVGY